MELDILAISDCGGILAVEVKKTKDPAGIALVRDFKEKIDVLASLHPDNRIIPAYFSTGGFTGESLDFCRENGIGTAREIKLDVS